MKNQTPVWAEVQSAYRKLQVDANYCTTDPERRFSLCRHSMNAEASNPVAPPGTVSPSTTLIAVGSPDTDANATEGSQAFSLQVTIPPICPASTSSGCQDTKPQGMFAGFQRGPEQLATLIGSLSGAHIPLGLSAALEGNPEVDWRPAPLHQTKSCSAQA